MALGCGGKGRVEWWKGDLGFKASLARQPPNKRTPLSRSARAAL